MSDVVRTYRAYGECRELGITVIPRGYVEVEVLSDGSLRLANHASPEAQPEPEPEPEPAEETPEPEPEPEEAEPEPEPEEAEK